MKKLFVLVIVAIFAVMAISIDANAAKKSKKGSIPEEEMTQMTTQVDNLTKKMYGRALFSPQDNQNLINIKIKLDNQMLVAPDPSLAPLYYKVGVLLRSREMKDESVDCFQTILENFQDTALAPKATQQLSAMGVKIQTTIAGDEEEE